MIERNDDSVEARDEAEFQAIPEIAAHLALLEGGDSKCARAQHWLLSCVGRRLGAWLIAKYQGLVEMGVYLPMVPLAIAVVAMSFGHLMLGGVVAGAVLLLSAPAVLCKH